MRVSENKSKFWKIYRIVLITAAVLAAIGIIYLMFVLNDYEKAQPKHIAENIFEEYFENFDAKKYIELCFDKDSSEDEIDNAVSYLKSITSGKEIKYYRVSTGVGDSYKYIVKSGDTKFASFMLVEDKKAEGKFKTYKAENFEIYLKSENNVVVTVPIDYVLYINGKEIAKDKIVEKNIAATQSENLPDGLNNKIFEKYSVSSFSDKTEIKVCDTNGTETTVEKLDDGTYLAAVISDNALREEYHEWILKGMKRYSEYMQHSSNNPVSFKEISVYFDPSSDLYTDIKTAENMFVWDYDSVEYEDVDTAEYIKYDENTFSCRCKFVQILHKSGEADYKDYLDVNLYLRNVDGEFLIYYMSQR